MARTVPLVPLAAGLALLAVALMAGGGYGTDLKPQRMLVSVNALSLLPAAGLGPMGACVFDEQSSEHVNPLETRIPPTLYVQVCHVPPTCL